MHDYSRCKPFLGTFVELTLTSKLSEASCLHLSNQMFDKIKDIQNKMSFHQPQSELSMINQIAYHQEVYISDEMVEVLTLALRLSQLTQGYYDITVASQLVDEGLLPDIRGSQKLNSKATYKDIILKGNKIRFLENLNIDLGGIAKGYAVDKAVQAVSSYLEFHEAKLVINAGGDLYMNQWQEEKVLVRSDTALNAHYQEVMMRHCSLATSGFENIRQPGSSGEIKSLSHQVVSVFAPSCILADALTKVVFLHERSADILREFNASAYILGSNGQMKLLS